MSKGNSTSGNWGGSPIHPVIDQVHEFSVVRFDYQVDPDDCRNGFIDMVLRRKDETRRLRFLRPRSLKIEEGFPSPTHGMIILDIRHRQWDGLAVEVADFEASRGRVLFYAADVIDLDRDN